MDFPFQNMFNQGMNRFWSDGSKIQNPLKVSKWTSDIWNIPYGKMNIWKIICNHLIQELEEFFYKHTHKRIIYHHATRKEEKTQGNPIVIYKSFPILRKRSFFLFFSMSPTLQNISNSSPYTILP